MGHLGYTNVSDDSLDEDIEALDELNPDLLDQIALAGKRFAHLMARFKRA